MGKDTVILKLEVTKDEHKQIEKAAFMEGSSISLYLRNKILPNSKKTKDNKRIMNTLIERASSTNLEYFDVPLVFGSEWYDKNVVPSQLKGRIR